MNPVSCYSLYEFSTKFRLVGSANVQNTGGLLVRPPAYKATALAGSGGVGSLTEERLGSFGLSYFALHNRSNATATVSGLGVRIANRFWIAGQWDDSEATPYTDDTTDAQDTGTDDFILETLTNDDGFVVASRVPFNCIALDISTASATTTPARSVRYLGSDQATWTAFGSTANLFLHDYAAAHYAVTGTDDSKEALIVWAVPPDWAKTPAAGLSGIPGGYYAVKIASTTAPTGTAGKADAISIYRLFFLTEGLGDNAILSQSFLPGEAILGEDAKEPTAGAWADGLVCLNAGAVGTAFHGNSRITLMVRSVR